MPSNTQDGYKRRMADIRPESKSHPSTFPRGWTPQRIWRFPRAEASSDLSEPPTIRHNTPRHLALEAVFCFAFFI